MKNSILFLQDYNLKNKFKSFDKNLFTQDSFISKNKISIINKSFNKYQITLKDKSYKINTYNDFMVKNIITILMVYNKILKNFH